MSRKLRILVQESELTRSELVASYWFWITLSVFMIPPAIMFSTWWIVPMLLDLWFGIKVHKEIVRRDRDHSEDTASR